MGLGLFNNNLNPDFFESPDTTIPYPNTAELFLHWSTNPATDGLPGQPRTSITLGYDPTLDGDPDYPFEKGHWRDTIELTWSGMLLPNVSGADLAVFEQGSPEAFALKAHIFGNGWTDWYFKTPGPSLNNDGDTDDPHGQVTLFDLTDLLVAPGGRIDAVQIRNMRPADTVAVNGLVTFGENDNDTATAFDPDIEYVVGLHPLVPEPGTLTILATNLAALGGAALRRRRRKQPETKL
jgi:MYXO-CTERM domain-containing protein